MRRGFHPWIWASVCVLGGLLPQWGEGQTPQGASVNPFKSSVVSTPWTAAQGGWAGRVVVDEWGIGNGCIPCLFNELGIRALMRRYPATVFIPLAYHMSYDWFWSDPAENIFTRYKHWYTADYPISADSNGEDIVDGQKFLPRKTLDNLDEKAVPQYIYDTVGAKIDAELRRPPEAFFHAQTSVHGGQIRVRVTVDSITGNHTHPLQTFPTYYYRILLVGDTIHFYSKNAVPPTLYELLRERYWVVYAAAHTPVHVLGLPIPNGGPGAFRSSPMEYTFDVAAIQRRIQQLRQGDTTYMNRDENGYYTRADILASARQFTDDRDWRLDPRHLQVVVMVTEAYSGEVFQAALVPVDGKRLKLQ